MYIHIHMIHVHTNTRTSHTHTTHKHTVTHLHTTHTHIHTHTRRTHTHARTLSLSLLHTHIYVHTHTHVGRVCMYVCMWVYTTHRCVLDYLSDTLVHVSLHISLYIWYTYTQTHAHHTPTPHSNAHPHTTHAHTRTHTHAHTHTHALTHTKDGEIALWSATNCWYVVKCVSQKRNQSNNKKRWYNILVIFTFKLKYLENETKIWLLSNLSNCRFTTRLKAVLKIGNRTVRGWSECD